jgi:hypothetical protein
MTEFFSCVLFFFYSNDSAAECSTAGCCSGENKLFLPLGNGKGHRGKTFWNKTTHCGRNVDGNQPVIFRITVITSSLWIYGDICISAFENLRKFFLHFPIYLKGI